MGLFDKKYCDICGNQIGLFGNRKVEDGNVCKDCASKLSPFFSDRRKSTIAEIKQQLQYRQQNEINLKSFNPTKIVGKSWKVYVDDSSAKFVVANNDYRKNNADLIDLKSVCYFKVTVSEEKDELFIEDNDGNQVSYVPPRYDYEYDFNVELRVNHPYFEDITFKLNNETIDDPTSGLFSQYVTMVEDIKNALGYSGNVLDLSAITNPVYSADGTTTTTSSSSDWYCPKCGNKNTENFCSKCGTARPSSVGGFCIGCGYKFETTETVKFCPKCGKQQF
ncbi:MAG: DUF4428 domain-containing protein [Erysipelotrichaceae bacterium]